MKFALWYEEMKRNLERFELARKGVECGKISGAVGTFANIPPFVQDYVCEHLGIDSAAISTQILQRDRHASYFGVLALIGASLACAGIAIFLFFGCREATKGTAKLAKVIVLGIKKAFIRKEDPLCD